MKKLWVIEGDARLRSSLFDALGFERAQNG
jgi:hypothetical protein